MGKCEKIITKSAKKERIGNHCGIYTSKKIDDIFYCKAHYDLVMKNREKDKCRKIKLNQQKEEEEEVQKEDTKITLENGFDLEEVMQNINAVEKDEIQPKKNVLKDLLLSMNNKLDQLLVLKELNKPIEPETVQFEVFN